MLRAARLALLLAVASCGGNVVVDSTTSQPTPPMCAPLCASIAATCPMSPPDCIALCESIDKLESVGACPSETSAYVACIEQNPMSLCMPTSTACVTQENAFLSCLVPFCQANLQTCM